MRCPSPGGDFHALHDGLQSVGGVAGQSRAAETRDRGQGRAAGLLVSTPVRRTYKKGGPCHESAVPNHPKLSGVVVKPSASKLGSLGDELG